MSNWPVFVLITLLLCWQGQSFATEFSAKTDTQFRIDDRSAKPVRYQYRVRFYPQLLLDKDQRWSMNAFAASGDEFSSSHNTLDDGAADSFYLRRLYLRHQRGESKTEVGVLPTYKGRVSSTGLSKDGWIAGIRHVEALTTGKLELVLGDLDDTRAAHAMDAPDKLSYVELEYSSNFDNNYSYEVSAERLLDGNFLRAELRYQHSSGFVYGFEVINRLQNNESKVVVSAEGTLNWFSQNLDLFTYYSYSDQDFGPRVELNEDFLANGHGVSFELQSQLIPSLPLQWFTRVEVVQNNSRIMLGVKYRFSI